MTNDEPAADARSASTTDPMLTSDEWDIVLDALLTEEGIARENARMWKGRSREDRYRREADEAVRIHDKLAAALAGRPAVPPDYVTPLNQPLPAMRWACGASASGFDLPSACPVHGASCDAVCEHGTALDVHCCNCHSGFIFDMNHECPDAVLAAPAVPSSAPPELSRAEWRLDATGALDDVVVENVKMFRMERVAPDHVWGALYYPNGTRTDFNIFMHDGQLALTFEHQFKET